MKIKQIIKHSLEEPVQVYDVINAAPNNNFFIRTKSSSIVSHNCFMDEISFARNQSIERQIEKATEVFDSGLERMKSRFTKFGGIYEGLMVMASSKRTDRSFLEGFTKKLLEGQDKNKVLVIDKPRWEILPPETYSGETFPIAVGDKFQPSVIIKDTPEEIEKHIKAGYKIMYPPIETYGEFDRNMEKALTNIAGISVGQISSYLRGDLVMQCVKPENQNLFKQSVIYSGYKDEDQYCDYIDLTRCKPTDFTLPLFIHLDASLGTDGNSMVGVLTDYAINATSSLTGSVSPELHYKELFKIKIRAPKGTKTSLEKNRNFIFWLIQQGFNVKGVSHDQFQSAEFHEILDRKGVPVFRQSIDAVKDGICPPYEVLKSVMYESRIDLLDDEDTLNELVSLERYENGKVDKCLGGTDDASQCLAGAVFLASKCKEEFLRSGAILFQNLDSSALAKPGVDSVVDINNEVAKHLSAYSSMSTMVQKESGLRKDFESFFGKEKVKEVEKGRIDPTIHWG